jgi:hypothetical protein
VELQALLETPASILLASDGSAVPGRGSFGWVVQIGGRIIARGKGPAYGNDPHSFRAEGYGMGSGLLFLLLLHEHFQIAWTNTTGNLMICDNKGLLIRIKKTLSWSYLQPNVTLHSEWDIESLILTTYRSLGRHFTFEHVYSHQDKTIAVEDLPLPVQLNVEADRITTEYLEHEDSIHQGRASLFLSAKCQLLLNGDSVTRKLPQAIRFQAGASPMRAYLMKHNHWDLTTLDSISWEAHGASHSYHCGQRVTLIKLCHHHLVLGKKLHRCDGKYPATCPGCNDSLESHDHFIGCTTPSHIKWHTNLLSATKQHLDCTKTEGNLMEAILNVMDRAIAGQPISVGGPFQSALRAQEQIGWRSMLQGYWAKEWQQCFECNYVRPEEESPDARTQRFTTMARWQTSHIKKIWTHMLALWKLRNDERHG